MRILAVDMGATNSRFALFHHEDRPESGDESAPRLIDSIWLKTQDFVSFEELIRGLDVMAPALSPLRADTIDCCVFAVAGPIQHARHASMTNVPYVLDLDLLPPLPPVILLNDFSAHALSCLDDACDPVAVLNADAPLASGAGVKAVLGAGSGLGMAALVPCDNGHWHVLSTEGGHASFSFESPEERAVQDFLRARLNTPYISAEDILSGKGLQSLHCYCTGKELSPAEIGRDFLEISSPTQTLFARFYGRISRNWVLQTLASSLHLTGGIAAGNPLLMQNPAFAEAFYAAPASHAPMLRTVPVYLNRNQNSALYGAARAALMAQRKKTA